MLNLEKLTSAPEEVVFMNPFFNINCTTSVKCAIITLDNIDTIAIFQNDIPLHFFVEAACYRQSSSSQNKKNIL